MWRHGVEDWRLSMRRSPGFAECDEHAGPADDGILMQGHGRHMGKGRLAPVAGNVERGNWGGGNQQQASQGQSRWQGQKGNRGKTPGLTAF